MAYNTAKLATRSKSGIGVDMMAGLRKLDAVARDAIAGIPEQIPPRRHYFQKRRSMCQSFPLVIT